MNIKIREIRPFFFPIVLKNRIRNSIGKIQLSSSVRNGITLSKMGLDRLL